MRRVAGARVNKLSERVAKRGLVAVVILRILPVAPLTIVKLVAGASMIGLRDFMLGTLIGMGPGILLTVAFAHQLVASLRCGFDRYRRDAGCCVDRVAALSRTQGTRC